jgi:hypothetical protein
MREAETEATIKVKEGDGSAASTEETKRERRGERQ